MIHEPRNRQERRTAQWAANHPDRIVRTAEAELLTGYCDVHLRRLEARGEFPRRFKLADGGGPYGAVGWRLSDIESWIRRRASTAHEAA